MSAEGIDVNAFPPELPPEPAGDDLEPDRAQNAPGDPPAAAEATSPAEPVAAAPGAPEWPPCDYCGGTSSLAIVYRGSGEREWSCFPCHGAVIARALNEAADLEQAASA